jgi:hypothetical protein
METSGLPRSAVLATRACRAADGEKTAYDWLFPVAGLLTDGKPPAVHASPTIYEALATLPRPRKHYQWYYSTRPMNAQCGIADRCPRFLRA